MGKRRTCRLVMEVPGKLALMSAPDLDSYVRAHWTEWQDKWRRLGCSDRSDAVLKVTAGQPMYLVERGESHYLVIDATDVPFNRAA